MEENKDSKIRFFLEPIQKIGFDDWRNSARRRNLKYHRIYSWVFVKILFLILCLPLILVVSFLHAELFVISLPTILVIVVYTLRLKILFQRVSKKIVEPIHDLKYGDFVAYEAKSALQIFVVLKKSMRLYYLKKINFLDIFNGANFNELKHCHYSELKIVKVGTFHKRFMRVVPVSTNQGSNRTIKRVA
jgi:hypothetical protein